MFTVMQMQREGWTGEWDDEVSMGEFVTFTEATAWVVDYAAQESRMLLSASGHSLMVHLINKNGGVKEWYHLTEVGQIETIYWIAEIVVEKEAGRTMLITHFPDISPEFKGMVHDPFTIEIVKTVKKQAGDHRIHIAKVMHDNTYAVVAINGQSIKFLSWCAELDDAESVWAFIVSRSLLTKTCIIGDGKEYIIAETITLRGANGTGTFLVEEKRRVTVIGRGRMVRTQARLYVMREEHMRDMYLVAVYDTTWTHVISGTRAEVSGVLELIQMCPDILTTIVQAQHAYLYDEVRDGK